MLRCGNLRFIKEIIEAVNNSQSEYSENGETRKDKLNSEIDDYKPCAPSE